jgi:SPP1 gp7 family putative phage head morphogenesis protein
MADAPMAQAVRREVAPKFRGRKTLKSKITPRYPAGVEREYVRVMNAYMKGVLAERLPNVRALLEAEERADAKGYRADKANKARNFVHNVDTTFDAILHEIEKREGLAALTKQLEWLSKQTWKRSVAEWKRMVKQTLGIDILEDYYGGGQFKRLMTDWVAENTALIKTVPQEMIGRMKNVVKGGYLGGVRNETIVEQIQETYNVTKDRAHLIARDQTAKLNSSIAQAQQEDAGVKEYVWDSSHDQRVRPCHQELNGTRHKWTEPPEQWYETKGGGKVYTGERAHPGQYFQCRCVALPVFDIEGLDLPWQK